MCSHFSTSGLIAHFNVLKARGWITFLPTCHNINTGSSYYSVHTIFKNLITGGSYQRSNFKKESRDLFKGYNPNDYYKKNHQRALFDTIVGPANASQYINNVQFMSRGHFSPVRDFPFKSWQSFTFGFSNAAPQWMSINNGAWKKVEIAVRSNNIADEYRVATGAYGVFKIKDKDGKEVELSLHNGQLPVPDYFWKLVQNQKDNSCIVFICTNNPFIKEQPIPFCTDICAANNWFQDKDETKNIKTSPTLNLTQGYLYCCSYEDLKSKKHDLYMPDFNCQNVLKFKKKK